MREGRKFNRRSFLGRVLGGAVVTGGALAGLSRHGAAHPTSDNDPADQGGHGTGTGRLPYADVDESNADGGGQPGRLGHFSDGDSGATADPVNHGRQRTDSDAGANSDPPNFRPAYSDGDTGPGADPVNRGRRIRRR